VVRRKRSSGAKRRPQGRPELSPALPCYVDHAVGWPLALPTLRPRSTWHPEQDAARRVPPRSPQDPLTWPGLGTTMLCSCFSSIFCRSRRKTCSTAPGRHRTTCRSTSSGTQQLSLLSTFLEEEHPGGSGSPQHPCPWPPGLGGEGGPPRYLLRWPQLANFCGVELAGT